MERGTVGLFISGACLLGGALFFWRSQVSAAPDSELEARLRRTEAELETVQANVRGVARGAVTTRQIVTRVAAAGAAAREPTEPAAVPARELGDPLERVRERMDAEVRDGAWAPSTERTLETAYRTGALDGTTLETVECRSTACQMTFSHPDASALGSFRRELARHNPLAESSMLVRTSEGDDGAQRSIVFVARSGHGLAGR